jgi:hypothetical protein
MPSVSEFRRFLPRPDDPRVSSIRGLDAYAYRDWALHDPFARALIDGWRPLYPSAFRGVTADGSVVPDLYHLGEASPGEEAPTETMVRAAEDLLGVLSPAERAKACYPIDAVEWQSWANPEFMQHDTGLRLEFVGPQVRDAVLALVSASLSPYGAELARLMMRINGYLGDIVGVPTVMNEFSYHFAVYGEPDRSAPWGWQLFGHHVAINVAVVGSQMVVSPVFLGAEPTTVDDGELAGSTAFTHRIATARALMAALPPAVRDRVRVYDSMVDPAMPEGRIHPGDERHLAGAFQDNRVIPYEGVLVSELPEQAGRLVDELVADFVALLPDGPAAARRREVAEHRSETWFSWIGGWEGDEPFYFRIQSPVAVFELDHHTGVFLTNDVPMGFHVHTVMRTPNGNDYAKELIRQYTAAR